MLVQTTLQFLVAQHQGTLACLPKSYKQHLQPLYFSKLLIVLLWSYLQTCQIPEVQPYHSICFPCARLTISKYANVVSIQGGFDHWLDFRKYFVCQTFRG